MAKQQILLSRQTFDNHYFVLKGLTAPVQYF